MTVMHSDPIPLPDMPREQRPSVAERFTQILDVFASGPDRMFPEEITAATGLPRSTVFRLLTQLVDLHWVEHDSRGYGPGLRMQTMARPRDYSQLRAAAAGMLNDLQIGTGGVAHLTVLEGSSVYFLDRIGGAASAGIPSQVATRLPAESTVSGRALLAGLEPERVDALMTAGPHVRSRADLSALHERLNRVRQRQGLAFVPGHSCPMSISAVAAPVVGPDGVVGAISVACRGTVELAHIAPMVWAAARRTSQVLTPGRSGSTARTRLSHRTRVGVAN